jgi:citrate lyase subunit beta / citryl-CoA lyase
MRPLRSLLFIPADSEKKLGKVDDCGADAVILDLEDSVAAANKSTARALVASFLAKRPRAARKVQLWVRINPLDSGMALADLVAVAGGAPCGIMQPKINSPDDVRILSHYLDVLEAQHGVEAGRTKIIPIVTETAIAPFNIGALATAGLDRMVGMTWGAEDLSAALGASTNRDASGDLAFTYRMVRSMTLLAAHASGVQAIDALHADFRDEDGLRLSSHAARGEGFTGRLAIHPAQVTAINESFMPSEAEVSHARLVVAAFAANPGVGTVGLDGKMIDLPHKKAAERVLSAYSVPDAGSTT